LRFSPDRGDLTSVRNHQPTKEGSIMSDISTVVRTKPINMASPLHLKTKGGGLTSVTVLSAPDPVTVGGSYSVRNSSASFTIGETEYTTLCTLLNLVPASVITIRLTLDDDSNICGFAAFPQEVMAMIAEGVDSLVAAMSEALTLLRSIDRNIKQLAGGSHGGTRGHSDILELESSAGKKAVG